MFDVMGLLSFMHIFIIQIHTRFNRHAYFSDNVTMTDMNFVS